MNNSKYFALPALLGVLFVAPLAVAETSPVTTDVAAKADKKATDPRLDSQAIVCKREDATGTRLGATKVCHTRAEWSVQAAEARQQMDRIQNTPQTH